MAKVKKRKRKRKTSLTEGEAGKLRVRDSNGAAGAALPRKVLRYLNAKVGDRLNIIAHNGVVEISPILSIKDEIEQFVSH